MFMTLEIVQKIHLTGVLFITAKALGITLTHLTFEASNSPCQELNIFFPISEILSA